MGFIESRKNSTKTTSLTQLLKTRHLPVKIKCMNQIKSKPLFNTNINHLRKVVTQLRNSQSMTYRQIILGERNSNLLINAKNKIEDAIKILEIIS